MDAPPDVATDAPPDEAPLVMAPVAPEAPPDVASVVRAPPPEALPDVASVMLMVASVSTTPLKYVKRLFNLPTDSLVTNELIGLTFRPKTSVHRRSDSGETPVCTGPVGGGKA